MATYPQRRAVGDLGPRALARRQALLDEVRQVVETTSWRQVSPATIARAVDASPATFYAYWVSLEAAFIELCETDIRNGVELTERMEEIYALVLRERAAGLIKKIGRWSNT